MQDDLLESLSLIGLRGGVIIALIIVLLVCGVAVALGVRARYGILLHDLRRNASTTPNFQSRLLNSVIRETLGALSRHQGDVNSQAIIEGKLQNHLRGLLLGERFVKANVGLLIILGLVGTFLGLTMSIGKLVSLVSSDMGDAALASQSLTAGLSEALSGMSVAFSTSLFGIAAAIVMTFVNVFVSTSDARTRLMAELEAFLDNTILANARAASGANLELGPAVTSFEHSVTQLRDVVSRFEASLQMFADNTRDFHEFNHHLKDNIQRMSVSFADLTRALGDRATRKGP